MDEEYKQDGGYDSNGSSPVKPKKINISDDFSDENFDYGTTPGDSETVLTIDEEDSSLEVGEEAFTESEVDEKVAPTPELSSSPLIEAEIEPETVAFVSESVEPNTATDTDSTAVAGASSARVAAKDKKRIIIIALASALLILVVSVTAWLLLRPDEPVVDLVKEATPTAAVTVPELDVTANLISGIAEYSRDGTRWLPLEATTKLKKGDSLRTGQESRAILTLENGNVLRLDANTSVALTSLAENKVEVLHSVGRLYSRVIADKSKYVVKVEESTYEAIGTAFMSSIDLSKRELQVYEGEVKASDIDMGSVSEGKQYHRLLVGETGSFEVTDIAIDLLTKDEFLKWNIAEDEKISDLSDAMGVLPMVGQRLEAFEAERAEAEAAAAADQAAKEAAEKEAAKKAEAEKEAQEKVSRAQVSSSAAMGILIDKRR